MLRPEVRGRISPPILFRTAGAIYEKLNTDESARVEDFYSVQIRSEFPDKKVTRVCYGTAKCSESVRRKDLVDEH